MKEKRRNCFKNFAYGMTLVLVVTFSWVFVTNIFDTSKFIINTKEIPINNVNAQYSSAYDGSIESMANIADYVFVAKVTDYIDTKYLDKQFFKKRNGKMQEAANIFTRYNVEVVENIKNELPIGSNILINKLGGIREDLSSIDIIYNDTLPEEGKTYIFMVTKIGDEYVVGGENSNLEITQDINSRELEVGNLDEILAD